MEETRKIKLRLLSILVSCTNGQCARFLCQPWTAVLGWLSPSKPEGTLFSHRANNCCLLQKIRVAISKMYPCFCEV
ncbi:unnamed protein product [Moneuplotes crassus]|uniref:Uncharacterized protein n=1 Tax=Euplotes crassus TaxID=5936 RepID=A0AAD2D8B0_EUPCR|nr:unnamed protein product [Moneuplotes crassus]